MTNFKTIQSRIARLKAIETMSEDGTFDVLPKKEVIALKKEWEKLEKLEKERENRMHGVLEPTQRETGDLQDNEVIVVLFGLYEE